MKIREDKMTIGKDLPEYRFQVLERHLDTFGHMNNAVYLQVYEESRWELITAQGLGLAEIMRSQVGPVILSAKIDFRRELRLREWIHIRSKCIGLKNEKILQFYQEMIRPDSGEGKGEKVVSSLELEFGIMDLKERKLITPSATWLRALGA